MDGGNKSAEFNSKIADQLQENAPVFEFSPSGHWIPYEHAQGPFKSSPLHPASKGTPARGQSAKKITNRVIPYRPGVEAAL